MGNSRAPDAEHDDYNSEMKRMCIGSGTGVPMTFRAKGEPWGSLVSRDLMLPEKRLFTALQERDGQDRDSKIVDHAWVIRSTSRSQTEGRRRFFYPQMTATEVAGDNKSRIFTIEEKYLHCHRSSKM